MAFNFLTNSQLPSSNLATPFITPQFTGDWLLAVTSYPYATPTGAWQNMTGSAGGVVQQIAPNTDPVNYTFSPTSTFSLSNIIFDFITNGSSPYESQEVSFGGGGIGTSGQATFSEPIVQGDSILVVFQNNTSFQNSGAMTFTDNAGNTYQHVSSTGNGYGSGGSLETNGYPIQEEMNSNIYDSSYGVFDTNISNNIGQFTFIMGVSPGTGGSNVGPWPPGGITINWRGPIASPVITGTLNIPQSALEAGSFGPVSIPEGTYHFEIVAISSTYWIGAFLALQSPTAYSQTDVFMALEVPAASSLTMNWTASQSIGDGEGTAWVVKNLLAIPPEVNIFFQAVPDEIMKGQTSTLSWAVTGATSQEIVEIGDVPASGSSVVAPTATSYYHLNAFNTGLPLGFPPLTSSGFTDNDTSLLLFISGETFAGESGTAFSVTLGSSDFQGLTITQACIQSTARSFSIPPPGGYTVDTNTPITFGGLASHTIPIGGSVTSDTIPFAFDDGHDYYVVLYTHNASFLGISYGTSFGSGGNVEVSSQQGGNSCLLTTTASWNQDPTFWRVFEGMNITLTAGMVPTATAVVEIEVLSNEAAFSLQKIILTLKQDRIPVRGRNG
jgi:hypothetical protein